MGGSLWEKPQRYVKNSSIFYLDKVTTPVLLFTGQKDSQVPHEPHEQSVEFFCALRRLDKPAWMLQYDVKGNGHVIWDEKNQLDYTIRMQQFFDHYLKGAPAPVWMTRGIPARLKGVITGYQLDPGAMCGKDCKVCKMWKDKWEKDRAACEKEMTEWEKF